MTNLTPNSDPAQERYTTAQNEAPAHKYFTQMLNIAEDDLDPFQYRLLAHYIRWTGHGGVYSESIRSTSKATRMGVNKVQSTLDKLQELGYLQVTRPTQEAARKGETISITIVDRWAENIARYQKDKPVSVKTRTSSVGVSNPIQVDTTAVSDPIHYASEAVSNQIRSEEQEKNKEPIALNSAEATSQQKPKPLSRAEQNAFYDAIAAVFETSASGIIGNYRAMMQGVAKVGDWKVCNFEPPVKDPAEICAFGEYMRQRKAREGITLRLTKPATIQAWFYDFRQERDHNGGSTGKGEDMKAALAAIGILEVL